MIDAEQHVVAVDTTGHRHRLQAVQRMPLDLGPQFPSRAAPSATAIQGVSHSIRLGVDVFMIATL